MAVLLGLAGCGSPSGSPSPEPQPSGVASPTAPAPAQPPPAPTPSIDIFAPAGWVALSDVDPTILEEVRYHGYHNFLGRPVAGYLEPICVLPVATAQALHRVQVAA